VFFQSDKLKSYKIGANNGVTVSSEKATFDISLNYTYRLYYPTSQIVPGKV
jgi:hypothetical protein